PFWFTSAGRYNSSSSSFDADITTFRDGQCFSCAFRRPTLQPVIGRIQLRFTNLTEGTLTWPFGTIAITRQVYGVSGGIEKMLGSYAFSTAGTSGRLHFGNWLRFTRTLPNASLGTIAEGTTEGGRIALAAFTADRTAILVLVDASTSFYESYLIPMSFFGTRGGNALWSTYSKTAAPVTPSALAFFSKIFSSAEVGAVGASELSSLKQTF
ncbi:MAG: hypothetical protein HC773_09515, partial [Scytonema sp. CRU_2_7]|nr:hypothetical protein [Scytonema sp. CRU_2_7]